MYSEEKKKIAVETYIKNRTRAAPTIRELGYPSRRIIIKCLLMPVIAIINILLLVAKFFSYIFLSLLG